MRWALRDTHEMKSCLDPTADVIWWITSLPNAISNQLQFHHLLMSANYHYEWSHATDTVTHKNNWKQLCIYKSNWHPPVHTSLLFEIVTVTVTACKKWSLLFGVSLSGFIGFFACKWSENAKICHARGNFSLQHTPCLKRLDWTPFFTSVI